MRRLLYCLLALVLAVPAYAAIIPSIPYTLTNGSLADATQVMGNFNTIVTDVNTSGAHNGANSDITSLTGLTTPLAAAYGGTVIYTGGTTSGTANAQTAATVSPSNFALTAGNIVTVAFFSTNTGAASLNTNGTGAVSIDKVQNGVLVSTASGDIVNNAGGVLYYDGSEYQLINPAAATLTTQIDSAFGSARGDILFRSASDWRALPPGTSGQVLQTAGAAANPLWTTPIPTATQAQVVAGTFGSAYVAPSVAQFSPGMAKAWVMYNALTSTVLASYNVGSVTKNGSGDLTVNFVSAFLTANYVMTGMSAELGTAVNFDVNIDGAVPPTASSCRVLVINGNSGANTDTSRVSLVFFGTQ